MTDQVESLSVVTTGNYITRIDSVTGMINHLGMLKSEINIYAHAMPGILRGIPCHDVISVSVDLMNEIDKLKRKFDKIKRRKPFCQDGQSAAQSETESVDSQHQGGLCSVRNNRTDTSSKPESMIGLLDEAVSSVNKLMQNESIHLDSTTNKEDDSHQEVCASPDLSCTQ